VESRHPKTRAGLKPAASPDDVITARCPVAEETRILSAEPSVLVADDRPAAQLDDQAPALID